MKELSLTRHAKARMAQRGVTLNDADLIALIGTEVEGGYLVRRKDCEDVQRALQYLSRSLVRVVGKRLVIATGQIITTYHATRKKERHLLRDARESNDIR
jgi:hypothetical protein